MRRNRNLRAFCQILTSPLDPAPDFLKESNNLLIRWRLQTYSVFTADTLRHAVTLTFDPLTLNFCSTSGVIKLCTNLTEIEQAAAEL